MSVNIFVSSSKKKVNQTHVHHFDLYGTREKKYEWLNQKSIENVEWNLLEPVAPNYFVVPKDFRGEENYKEGFQVNELFQLTSTGVKTHRNGLVISEVKGDLESRLRLFTNREQSDDTIRQRFDLKDNRDWQLDSARRDIIFGADRIVPYIYTPFDHRFIYYEKGLIDFARENVMKHFLSGPNVALVLPKQVSEKESAGAFVTKWLCDHKSFAAYNTNNVFPLYLYPGDYAQQTLDGRAERVPNLNMEIVDKIAAGLGLTFVAEKEEVSAQPQSTAVGLARPDDAQSASSRSEAQPPSGEGVEGESDGQASLTAMQCGKPENKNNTFAPIDILDYIYAVLHSPSYREKYKEFLKIDFPRVPYPKDAATFWRLVALGGELRQIHLLESPAVSKFITGFNVGGDNVVEKPVFKTVALPLDVRKSFAFPTDDSNEIGGSAAGSEAEPQKVLGESAGEAELRRTSSGTAAVGSVFINASQYFSGVPETAWNFYIGGYQPAQKWLKDRKGRKLSFEDIQHYQKIIVALIETDRLMKEIDTITTV